MSKKITIILIAAILLCSEPLPIVLSQTPSKLVFAPAIEWQKSYGENSESVSNLIQTTDGGYIFMDLAWAYSMTFKPSTVYKVDSAGNMQWNKTIDNLAASAIIQTNDGGYEIAGSWTIGVTYQYTPTLIKMDSQGNIQWVANYSSALNLGTTSTSIRTSDGGFAYRADGSIIKTDSHNNTQWIETFNFTDSSRLNPLPLFSVIETSDGALAALGVGTYFSGNPRTGIIYLIKTEAFLPPPSQTPLPTPMPTSLPALTVEGTIAVLVIIVVAVVVGVSLLVYFKKRKHQAG
jgi:hypothetical protein